MTVDDRMRAAAALVAAGLVSVLLFPAIALAVMPPWRPLLPPRRRTRVGG